MCIKKERFSTQGEKDLLTKKRKQHNDPGRKRQTVKKEILQKKENQLKRYRGISEKPDMKNDLPKNKFSGNSQSVTDIYLKNENTKKILKSKKNIKK